jgi:hypothetical protein
MLRLLFVFVLVWPQFLPPGVCTCCLAPALLPAAPENDSDEHEDHHDHGDCPGAKKVFLVRTAPDAGELLTCCTFYSVNAQQQPVPDAPTGVTPELALPVLTTPPSLWLLLCALLI